MTTITQHFTLGDPQIAGPLAVFPVFGPEPRLEYRAFADATALGAFVKERDGRASVSELVVGNPTDLPLLVYEGEEVLGAQQNRTFDSSILVGARSEVSVPVSCVEQGRWDSNRHDEQFEPSPQAADPSLRRVKRRAANLSAAAGGPVSADQGEVWANVVDRLDDHHVDSPSAAMSDVFEERRKELDELLDGIRPVPEQVGAIAQIGGVPVALDLVSRPGAFATLLPRLARGYALDALGRDSADPDPRAAEEFAREAVEATRLPQPTPGLGVAFGLVSTTLLGSGIEHDEELVQVCAFPSEPDGPGLAPLPVDTRIGRPSERRRGLT